MNPWQLIYVVVGAWAIFTIVWAIALDAIALGRWARDHSDLRHYGDAPLPPRILGGRTYAAAIAVLVGLWLAAAVLR